MGQRAASPLGPIRDEFRETRRRPAATALDSGAPADDPSPLECAIGAELGDEYEQALARLRPEEREAIVGRIEMDLSYEELAETLGRPNANAARSVELDGVVEPALEHELMNSRFVNVVSDARVADTLNLMPEQRTT